MAVEKSKLVEMYRMMVRVRRFEESALKLYSEGKIHATLHSYIGQEAVSVGACLALNKDDYITTGHRAFGHVIAKGAKMDRFMAEIFGKETGYCKGRTGHYGGVVDISLGMLGASGIVGAGITVAVGYALSAKLRGTMQVAVAFFGDGASNTGRFHEAMNLASVWKLPVIFVCENNLYAISVPQRESANIRDIAVRGAAYGIPGIIVDGMDVIAVYEAVTEAVERARKGEGPALIECKTYRYRGHFEGDAEVYRTKEELEEWKKRDAIKRLKQKLLETGVLGENEVEEIDRQVQEEVDKAITFALESRFPDREQLLQDVYA
jgi:TPP-dependent pyruvate/acetoin dehydrogenase alpha subunit